MPIFSKSGKNILFIHIPKSAGSSVEKIGKNCGWFESFSVRGKPLSDIAYYKASLQHLHADVLGQLFFLEKFDAIFTIVRNPFDRFKSEYYWQKSQSITTLNANDWIADTLARYEKYNHIYDNHIRPQIEFIPRCGDVEVLKLEDDGVKYAANIFNRLAPSSLGWGVWRNVLRSIKSKNIAEKKSVKDPVIELIFQKEQKKIVDFYKADFEAFSYKC